MTVATDGSPRETGAPAVPLELERFRGQRGAIFAELGNGVIGWLAHVFDASPQAIGEFLGVTRGAMSKRMREAGIITRRRDPFVARSRDPDLEMVRELYWHHCKRRDEVHRCELQAAFGEAGNGHGLLVCVSDLHFGAPEFDADLWDEVRDWLIDNPDAGLCLLGDLFDVPTARSPGVQFGGFTMTLSLCQDLLREELAPLASQVRFVLRGNHDARPARDTKTDVDPVREFCGRLDLPYIGYNGWVQVAVGRQSYLIYATHGSGGGRTLGGAANRLKAIATNNRCDAVLMGHVHQQVSAQTAQQVVDEDGLVQTARCPVMTVSSFQRYRLDGYAAQKDFSPSPCGPMIVALGGERRGVALRMWEDREG